MNIVRGACKRLCLRGEGESGEERSEGARERRKDSRLSYSQRDPILSKSPDLPSASLEKDAALLRSNETREGREQDTRSEGEERESAREREEERGAIEGSMHEKKERCIPCCSRAR